MRKKLIAGNWKMNKTVSETEELLVNIKHLIHGDALQTVDVLVCPPFVSLYAAKNILGNSNIHLGAQNIHQEEEGAYTGEVSAKMLVNSGCSHVIVGHSERRQYFIETNELINLKLKKALEHGLVPVVCVGETLDQREKNVQIEIVNGQITKCLAGLDDEEIQKIVIAYEPVWAIGTGKTATPEQANEMHINIRNFISELFNNEISENIVLLYGGSLNDKNAEELLSMSDIDGGLIGGASLKAESFVKIINIAKNK